MNPTDLDEIQGRLSALELLVGESLIVALVLSPDPKAMAESLTIPPEVFDRKVTNPLQRQWAVGMHSAILNASVEHAVNIRASLAKKVAMFARSPTGPN